MHSGELTLRTVKRGGNNVLTIESDNLKHRSSERSNEFRNQRRQSVHTPSIGPSYFDQPVPLAAGFHDTRSSTDAVCIDVQSLPGAKEGDVAELITSGENKKKLLFIVKNMNDEMIRRSKNFQVSILSGTLQNLLDISSRSPVTVKLKDKQQVELDLVELHIRDISLTRGDMWEIASLMVGTCAYKNQRLSFFEGVRCNVNALYNDGKKLFSGYIGDNTKVIFRSESAKLVFLIQITEEMYHFEEDGELMYHKVVNSLFPKIFKKWREEGTHHLITIVFVANVDSSENSWLDLKDGECAKNSRDFYRVVVDQVNIVHWNEIMISLRYEFANFKKYVMEHQLKQDKSSRSRFLPIIKADILNTINLSTTLVIDRFRDPDLRHTTTHFIVISPGNGIYDVEYDDLLETGKRLLNTEISVDIICLAQPALHVTPLFRYRDKYGNLHHCVPGWIDISFWSDRSSRESQWIPKTKIYELQMMGIMENELSAVTVEHLNPVVKSQINSIVDLMDDYDNNIFSADSAQRPELTQNNSMRSLQPKRKDSTLFWKITNASATKSEPITTAEPTFSVSRSAVSSLQQIGKTESRDSSKRSTGGDTSSLFSRPPTPKRIPISRPLSASSNNFRTSSNQAQKSQGLSSSPISETSNTPQKEKITAADTLKTVMWTEIGNPSQSINIHKLKTLSVGKWQDVFPKNVKRRKIKWRSLVSPSELPISTPLFPTVDDFENNFTFQTHSISLSPEHEKFMNSNDLMRDMIHLRLVLGFQICYGSRVDKIENKRQSEGNASLLMKYLPKSNFNGLRIYMSLDEEIHRISCDYNGLVNVQRYNRIHNENMFRDVAKNVLIKTRYQLGFGRYEPDPNVAKPRLNNWNQYDQLLAGYDDDVIKDNKLMNRVKFVLLPTEVPKSTYLTTSHNNDKPEQLSEEETRVEGLRKLISTLHRGTFSPDNNSIRKKSKKEEIFPEINFYTGNLVSFLKDQNIVMDDGSVRQNSVGTQVLTKEIPTNQLIQEIQGSKGIKLIDRRWHWKVHSNCFLGLELVSWLIENFEDINTREEAVEYGNFLLDQGLFAHVEKRHRFLDGHYFYQIIEEFVSKPDSINETLKTRSRGNSIGSKNSKISAITPVIAPQSGPGDNTSMKKTKSEASELVGNGSKKTYVLSKMLKFDIDPSRKSYKREVITVHYDTVHNPNHCFHVRVEWLTATPKLIDDTINGWSRMCERYGLKLVETPWNELCEIPRLSPFHSFVDIKLALNPWEDKEFNVSDIISRHKFYYHIYLLEYSGFLLDNRASLFFKTEEELEVLYSWGKPQFKYAQYIHKTGAYIAEIRDTGDLFLAPNNRHLARVNVGNVSSQQQAPSFFLDSQKIMLEFRATCLDSSRLKEVFLKAKNSWVSRGQVDSAVLSPIQDDLTLS
ncbi:Vacuolar membrane-associated protein IML1 [Wickerhamomyces ciferrii]|uniref:Vacuolar membrane-associated protein IML1 n=1 Tax=Wickerhamomyces ciferrii (strain ATCC 14091 / BCRC 22168 / CBS 111 / JCM 3599 / NBRC 0793 / NRRL Y-1031 F-60-10) TaxID=1206466 RepID=K0KNN0_WICCF|nr:Vacuolar membrane-associated protein IML1 [Wickerhamomyces ciferrii]CCH44601.1 Vacuolar membrane-associated protein IML1 [Wickerhamomyces ciferrii]